MKFETLITIQTIENLNSRSVAATTLFLEVASRKRGLVILAVQGDKGPNASFFWLLGHSKYV